MKKIIRKIITFLSVIVIFAAFFAISVSAASKPKAPEKITVTQTTNSITLDWSDVKGADGYKIFYKTSKSAKWKTAVSSVTESKHTFKKLPSGKVYYFAVRSYDKTQSGTVLGGYKETVTATKPGATERITAKQSSTAVKLTWSAVKGATKYRVYQKVDGKWKSLGYTTKLTKTIKNLSKGTKYRFAVKAYLKNDAVTVSGAGKTIETATKPSAPKNLKATATDSSVTFNWSKVEGATMYCVFQKTAGGWKTVAKTTVNQAAVINLNSETKYTFAVKAYITTASATVKSTESQISIKTKVRVKIPDDIKKKADEISQKYGAVAVQVAVMKGNAIYYTYEYGYADKNAKTAVIPDTKFRVASISKLVTDCVFMKLCDLGLVSIDGDISTYLGFEVRNPYYPDVVITPAMLMSHSSTIANSNEFEDSLDNESYRTIQNILSYNSAFYYAKPGTFYAYSNFGVAIIGAICEKVTGMYFNDIAKKYLFEPLGIDASYLAKELKNPNLLANIYGGEGLSVSAQMWADHHATIGQIHHLVQGNLLISAQDYCKILSMLSSKGLAYDSVRILSEKSVSEMFKPRINDGFLGSGFGIERNPNIIKNKTLYSHTGNSYGLYSSYIFDPKTGNGIVILTSGAYVAYLDDVGIYDICLDFVNLMFPQ